MKAIFSKKNDKLVVNGKIEPDGMKLFIDVERICEGPVSRQDIVDLIKDSVKLDLVDMDVLHDIAEHLNDPDAEEAVQKDRRIAKGKPAETGVDGKLLLLVKALTGEIEMAQEEQQVIVNYRDIHLFDNIESGRVVARIYEPKTGHDGFDALGKVLPGKKGNPLKISLDKTLQNRPPAQGSAGEYSEIVAQTEGYLLTESGRLSIQQELVIKGNLDYHAGNLDFVGRVKVLGDVMPDFRIAARSNVEVRGMVRGENVILSKAGDVIVHGFVYGGASSKIVAAHAFQATVLQEVNAEVVGDVNIKKEAVDCLLRVGGSLLMAEGSLMGGVAHVVKGVEAKRIGNEAGQKTVIVLCSSVEATMEYEQLLRHLEDHEQAIEALKSHLGPLFTNPDRISFLVEPLRSKMEKLFGKLKAVIKSRDELRARQQSILGEAKADLVMRVNYTKFLFPGVTLVVGKHRHEIKDLKTGPGSIEFDPEKEEFVEVEYKALQGAPSESKGKK